MAAELSGEGYGVLSAFVDGADENNALRHIWLREDLKARGYDPIEALGEWEGVPELVWIIPCIPESVLLELGAEYGQEAVIHCPSGGKPTLKIIIP